MRDRLSWPLCRCGHPAIGHNGYQYDEGQHPTACDYRVKETKQWCACRHYKE
jgi:hypothetical protein